MPNIFVKLPEGTFDQEARERLARGITAAAKTVEGYGDAPAQEFLTWLVIEEIKQGHFYAAGVDPLSRVIPVIVLFHPPAGVLDADARAAAVRLVHEAVALAKPSGDTRPVMTSVIVSDVGDGTWGANGALWHLPDFARAAGYKHLRHLLKPTTTSSA